MTDPRFTPKTLAEVAAEFRAMMEDAIRQNHFEVAATCKQFLRAVEAAQTEIDALREDKARLDWMQSHPLKAEVHGGSDDGHTGTFWGLGAASGTLREVIDTVRTKS